MVRKWTAEGQGKIFNEKVQAYMNEGYSRERAERIAKEWVAVPGTSEHQNGISDYGFEILRYQEGAADLGIGKLSFSGNGYVIDKLYYSESQYNSNNELEVQYIANGTPYSEEEFNHDMSHQGEKSNVKWYDLTPGNVESAYQFKES